MLRNLFVEMLILVKYNIFQAELAECLEKDGFKSIYEAVGADCR